MVNIEMIILVPKERRANQKRPGQETEKQKMGTAQVLVVMLCSVFVY